jgi:hypothetical protein
LSDHENGCRRAELPTLSTYGATTSHLLCASLPTSSIRLFVLATSFSMNAAGACNQAFFVIVGSNRGGIIKLMLIRSEDEQSDCKQSATTI